MIEASNPESVPEALILTALPLQDDRYSTTGKTGPATTTTGTGKYPQRDRARNCGMGRTSQPDLDSLLGAGYDAQQQATALGMATAAAQVQVALALAHTCMAILHSGRRLSDSDPVDDDEFQ